MSIYQWLCLLGIPSIIVGMLGFVKVWIKQMRAVKLGLQAILRDRLLQAYHYYKEQGYASYDEKQNVVNLYTQYEALGPNGIMQRKHEAFLALPEEPVNNPN
jgi:hypothetical protein